MGAGDEGFLGRGWSFPVAPEPRADPSNPAEFAYPVAEAAGSDKIRQSIWLILSTSPGERIGRPDFGCGIHDLVFAPRTAGTLGEVARSVTAALRRWEPRIALLAVDARPSPDDANGILVQIQYEVRATNSRFNFVYPFYLST